MNNQAKVDLYRRLLRQAKTELARVTNAALSQVELDGLYRQLETLRDAATEAQMYAERARLASAKAYDRAQHCSDLANRILQQLVEHTDDQV